MYESPQSDPNEREQAPFEHQFGPPQYQGPQQQQPYQGGQPGFQQQVLNQPPPQPYNGNGHGNTYQQPQRRQQGNPLAKRLYVLEMAAKTGAFQVAQLWAEQIALFRQECQSQGGLNLTDREALDIITSLLYQAAD